MEKSIFNPRAQQKNPEFKIIVALERLSEAFRVLLWEQANKLKISPIQIQVLVFIQYHPTDKCKVSFLAQEFNMSKPTISDAVKTLEQKGLLRRESDLNDSRSHTLHLTEKGQTVATRASYFAQPMLMGLEGFSREEKGVMLGQLLDMIERLQNAEVISVQRMCLNCQHHEQKNGQHYCHLMRKALLNHELQVDCREFVLNPELENPVLV
jgi:DNA-binding MarR family transcriptional regulator